MIPATTVLKNVYLFKAKRIFPGGEDEGEFCIAAENFDDALSGLNNHEDANVHLVVLEARLVASSLDIVG